MDELGRWSPTVRLLYLASDGRVDLYFKLDRPSLDGLGPYTISTFSYLFATNKWMEVDGGSPGSKVGESGSGKP